MSPNMRRSAQRGFLLLEVLIAILLFSIGILAIVSLQGTSIATVTQSKVRSDASFLADQLIGQIWANRANANSYAYAGSGTPPAVLTSWMQAVQTRMCFFTPFTTACMRFRFGFQRRRRVLFA